MRISIVQSISYFAVFALVEIAAPVSSYADQGITSPTHRKYLGQIVWSTKRISFGKERPRRFRTHFKANQPIFGRLYTRRALGRTPTYLRGGSRCGGFQRYYGIRLLVDGKSASKRRYFHAIRMHRSGIPKWTTWRIEPHALPLDRDANRSFNLKWVAHLNKMSPGTHKIQFIVYATDRGNCQSKRPLAQGGFTLQIPRGLKLKFAGKFPKGKFRGPGASSIKRAVRRALLRKRIARRASQILKVSILSQRWHNGRFRRTGQRFRTISATILWADNNKDGICSYTSYNFIQTFGGGRWNSLRFRSFCLGCLGGSMSCP